MEQNTSNISPLYDLLETNGAIFSTVIRNDNTIIRNFGSFDEEYSALYSGVGIRDLSGEGIIQFSGKDTLDFLQRISTNDVHHLQYGESVRTIITNENGRIIDYITLIHCGDTIVAVVSSVYVTKLLQWFDKYIIMDDVKAVPTGGRYVLLEILGPRADSFVENLFGSAGSNLKVHKTIQCTVDNAQCTLVRCDPINTIPRYWLLADADCGITIFQNILNTTPAGTFRLVGSEAFDVFRIEQGIPAAPNELNDEVNPHEAAIIHDVSFTKGCYIGQEVIARLDTYDKVQKHLRGVLLRADRKEIVPGAICKLYTNEGKSAGIVTSVAFSPKLNKHIGLGYIRKNFENKDASLIAKNEHGAAFETTLTDIPMVK